MVNILCWEDEEVKDVEAHDEPLVVNNLHVGVYTLLLVGDSPGSEFCR